MEEYVYTLLVSFVPSFKDGHYSGVSTAATTLMRFSGLPIVVKRSSYISCSKRFSRFYHSR